MPEPVFPPRVSIADLDQVRTELGLSVSMNGPGTYDLVLHDSLRLEIESSDDAVDGPTHVRVCTSDIEAARRSFRDAYGVGTAQTNTVDPTTMRSQGVLLQTPSLVVTAVRCPAAGESGTPCGTDCSPNRPATPTQGHAPPVATVGAAEADEAADEDGNGWPKLPVDDWADTVEALHLWSQVVGKIRLGYSPWLNHSWSVPLYLSPTGLRTSLVPYGHESFELSLDLLSSTLDVRATTGASCSVELRPQSTAEFYAAVLEAMASINMAVTINPMPSEIADAIPFHHDTTIRNYDSEHAKALWQALINTERVMSRFRAGFTGKASPVHFFWGSFDLAATRFSGRTAPPHPGGIPNFPDDVAREAYSHEVTSVGFWPGNRDAPDPIFYAYAYPTPDGFSAALVTPDSAAWHEQLGEFVLPYGALQGSTNPDETLLAFFESTHGAAADLAGWDRDTLECRHPAGPDWWHQRPHEQENKSDR